MKKNNINKKFLFCTIAAIFATTQMVQADGLANASINSTAGGFVGMETGMNSATLNFNKNAVVNWNKLNVGRGETLNFNAVNGASGLTVLNRVTGRVSEFFGTINSNAGISKLIISNPNGLIFDGANFNAAGDVMLTTQKLAPQMNVNGDMDGVVGVNEVAKQKILTKNSNFNVGGDFKMVGPKIFLMKTNINTPRLKLTTRDGQEYLVNDYIGGGSRGTLMRAVSVNGNILIVSGKDPVTINAKTNVNGNLSIYSQGDVKLNYNTLDTYPQLNINGNLIVENNNGQHGDVKLRNVDVAGDLYIDNSIGDVIVRDTNVENSTLYSEHYASINAGNGYNSSSENIALIGNNTFNGTVHLNASGNVIVGNQNIVQGKSIPGSLNVSNGLYVKTFNGNVLFKDDVNANVISVDSARNILTAAGDGSVNGETAMLNANTYGFFTTSGGYTGAIENEDSLDGIMNHQFSINNSDKGYMNIGGGTLMGIGTNTSEVRIKSHDDLAVNQYTTGNMYLTAVSDSDPLGSDIKISPNVSANEIVIGGETKNVSVPLQQRNYNLKFTNIRDNEITEIGDNQAITYEDFNAPGGYNDGVQTELNTKINAPTEPDRFLAASTGKKPITIIEPFFSKKRK